MAEPAGFGRVEQKNIDAILNNVLRDYRGQQQYTTNIHEAAPSW